MSFRKPCHMPFRKLIPPFTLTASEEGFFFQTEILGNLFRYVFCFIILFTSSSPCRKDQFAVSYFSTSLIVLIQGPDVRRSISANQGLNFNPGFFSFCSKAFSRTVSSLLFRASNHQIVGKKNKTEFAPQAFIPEIKFRTNPGLT